MPYFGHTLTNESSNLQFVHSGVPQFGAPDGFGVAQIDASGSDPVNALVKLSDSAFWSWHWNLQEGINLAASFQDPAYTYFTQQLQAEQFDMGTGGPLPSPIDATYCQMTWDGTGRNGLQDAEWIELYNSGGSLHYAKWKNSQWNYTTSYVYRTCNAPSLTIPN